ncbi:AlbA family DNA-binding domain-containing protein [Actinoalloteichus spitiensis]|uniref:AlbA family DNA-binding domain-containing protein n=1 Tax=Actinoalloteichus spitiensis TaxID=252394 RepID=UPI0012F623B5|nr:ATP-binding protein [Actinoalloteichus spitiensis]
MRSLVWSAELGCLVDPDGNAVGGRRDGALSFERAGIVDVPTDIELNLADFNSDSVKDFVTLSESLPGAPCRRLFVLWADGAEVNPILLGITSPRDLTVEIALERAIPFGEQDAHSVVASVLSRVGCTVEQLKYVVDSAYDSAGGWELFARVTNPGVRLADLAAALAEAARLLAVSPERNPGRQDKATVLANLRKGAHDAMIGLQENSWLEFKQSVNLTSEAAKIELAQDVSRFANAESGGILSIGYRTEKRAGLDTVAKPTPVPTSMATASQCEKVIDSRVYPMIRGLEVFEISAGNGLGVITIVVPAQMEDDKPFLVHGAIVEGEIEGGFFSIVRRRGEGSVPISAREIHAALAAGHKILRGSRHG